MWPYPLCFLRQGAQLRTFLWQNVLGPHLGAHSAAILQLLPALGHLSSSLKLFRS